MKAFSKNHQLITQNEQAGVAKPPAQLLWFVSIYLREDTLKGGLWMPCQRFATLAITVQ